MQLSSILDPGCVVLDVGTGSKREVLEQLVAAMARNCTDLDGSWMLDELVRREEESSTAIADGIAIPHARPEAGKVTAAFGRSKAGTNFDSLDGKPTKLLFVLMSPRSDPSCHGVWLAHIARVISDPRTRARLLDADTREQILEVLRERETEIEADERNAKKEAS